MANAHPTQILSLPTESFADALRRLDPASRALLDLSLRRGMRPEEIAEVLGADPDTVVSSRDHALEHVASELGLEPGDSLDELRARLAELPGEYWTGGAVADSGAAAAEPEADEEPEPSNVVHLPARTPIAEEDLEAAAPAPATERERSSRAGRLLLLALVLAAAIVVIVVAASGGGKSNKHHAASAPPSSSAPTPAPSGGTRATLAPVGPNGAGAKGTAIVSGKRLHVRVTGLPTPRGATYEVWLYNSVIDATPVGSSAASPLAIDARLPANARHFRLLDVSLEPADGNPAHSGNSVLRVRLSKLLK
jgi:hypothetical protein